MIDTEEPEIEEKETATSEEREEEAQVNNEEPEEEEAEATEAEEVNEEDELEAAFNDFKKTTSEHKNTEEAEEKTKTAIKPKLDENEEFLISMFSGMFFSLCDGLHGFLFNFFSKHKLDSEAIELSEPQKKGLEVYFKTERVIKFLNKLSPELLGFVHMEWLYFQNMKLYNKKQDELLLEQKKKVPAKEPTVKKKKRKKKKVAKKVKPDE